MERLQEIKQAVNYYQSLMSIAKPQIIDDVNWLIETIEQYQLNEIVLLEKLKKQTLELKEMKRNGRLNRFFSMAEENLKMAQKVAELEGELIGYRNQAELSQMS